MSDITCAGAWCRSCTTAERGHSGAVRGTDTTCGRADCGESSALTTTSICCTSCTTCSAASASTVRRSRASRSTSGHHAAVQAVHGRRDDGGGRPYRRSRLVKLRSHLVLLIVVAIIPAVAVSAVALYFFAAQTKTTVETSLVDTARALSIAVQVPVSIDGGIRYMLAASLRTDALADLLTEQRVPAGTVGTLVDRNKIVLARTGGGERAVGQPAPSDLADNVSEMAEGHFSTVRGEGQPVFVAFSTSPVTGWTIALSTPRSALSQPFESSLKLFGGGALLVISLGVVVALMLSRRVSSSLRSLASAAAAMNSGAPVRVPRSRVQEVKAIGEALLAVHRERERSEEHRALLLADAEHRRRAAESLNDVKALVSESLEPESVAQAVVNAMARLLGAPMVVLYRTDPDSSDLVLVSEVGAPGRRGWHLPRATGTVAMALETGP